MEEDLMEPSETRMLILRDLADSGPMALETMRDAYGGYVYPCMALAQREGLVEYSERTRCYSATEKGRALAAASEEAAECERDRRTEP